jgi:hypothetical protein
MARKLFDLFQAVASALVMDYDPSWDDGQEPERGFASFA